MIHIVCCKALNSMKLLGARFSINQVHRTFLFSAFLLGLLLIFLARSLENFHGTHLASSYCLQWLFGTGRKYSKDQITLLFVGRGFVRKGGYFLLRAFERLRKKYSVRLIIIGTRRRFVLDGVHFAGEVTDSVLVQAFRIADVFVLPTLAEAYRLVFWKQWPQGCQ